MQHAGRELSSARAAGCNSQAHKKAGKVDLCRWFDVGYFPGFASSAPQASPALLDPSALGPCILLCSESGPFLLGVWALHPPYFARSLSLCSESGRFRVEERGFTPAEAPRASELHKSGQRELRRPPSGQAAWKSGLRAPSFQAQRGSPRSTPSSTRRRA